MAYCAHCGKEVDDNAVVCIHCGCHTMNDTGYSNVNIPNEKATLNKRKVNLLSIIGFIVSCISVASFVVSFEYGYWLESNSATIGAVISAIGLVDCKQQNQSGKILAIIGVLVGIIIVLFPGLVAMITKTL